MTSVENDLGRDVLGGAAEGPRLGALVDALAEAEVDHLDVAARVEEQVLRFEVAVNDAAAVQVVWEENLLIYLHGILRNKVSFVATIDFSAINAGPYGNANALGNACLCALCFQNG